MLLYEHFLCTLEAFGCTKKICDLGPNSSASASYAPESLGPWLTSAYN